MTAFVPDSFVPPAGLDHPAFRLRPLGPEHNESDYAAWTSSLGHIHATPGFEDRSWPREMTRDENRQDLVRHAADFDARRGFTYTVLQPGDSATVVGCVYVYPAEDGDHDAAVSSWVRAADAHLDPLLHLAVSGWLADAWPFHRALYRAATMPRRLARLNVTPVKGMALQHPDVADLTDLGIPSNRRFHLVDERGRLFSGGDHGPLVRLRASFDQEAETLTITFPDGSAVTAASDDLAEPHLTDFYGRPVTGRIVAGPLAEAVGAFVGRPLRLVRTDREGDGPDVHRLSIVSWASVRDLGSRSGRPDLDPLRFRMNLELDGCEAFEEDTWDGRPIRIGEAVIRVLGPVPRCVVTTQDPATGLKDFDTLKRISEFRPLVGRPRGVPFGVYAEVQQPGRVSIGDPLELPGS